MYFTGYEICILALKHIWKLMIVKKIKHFGLSADMREYGCTGDFTFKFGSSHESIQYDRKQNLAFLLGSRRERIWLHRKFTSKFAGNMRALMLTKSCIFAWQHTGVKIVALKIVNKYFYIILAADTRTYDKKLHFSWAADMKAHGCIQNFTLKLGSKHESI